MPHLQQMGSTNFDYGGAALTNSVIIIALLGLFLLILIPIYILNGITYSKIAKKANISDPWIAWVPYGGHFISLKIGGLSPYFLLYFIAGVFIPMEQFGLTLLYSLGALVILIQMDRHLLSAFGKDGDLAFLHLLPIFGSLIVLAMILSIAFSKQNNYVKAQETILTPDKTEIHNSDNPLI